MMGSATSGGWENCNVVRDQCTSISEVTSQKLKIFHESFARCMTIQGIQIHDNWKSSANFKDAVT
jgi:hypothetical protein